MSESYDAYVAQPATSVQPTQSPSIWEGAGAIALLGLIIRAAIEQWNKRGDDLRKKDDDESELIHTLIDDLRKERDEWRNSMGQALARIDSSQQQIAIAIRDVSQAVKEVNASSQQNARIFSEIFGMLREQEKVLHRIETHLDDR